MSYDVEPELIKFSGIKQESFLTSRIVDYHDKANDLSSEEDDEVFAEDPGAEPHVTTKPLMPPRQRPRRRGRRGRCSYRRKLWPAIYLLLFIGGLIAFVCLIVYVVNSYTRALVSTAVLHGDQYTQLNKTLDSAHDNGTATLIGCSRIEIKDVWISGFPKMITESSIRLLDVNRDGVLDIILGFGTGGDGLHIPDIVCDIYFNGSKPCAGGILALDGATGKELWRCYSVHELFGINCNEDLNGDGVNDCTGGGRNGAFQAVSGADGKLLWTYKHDPDKGSIMNLYTAQFIRDMNGDGVVDILNIHGGDPLREPGSKFRLSAWLVIFSGKDGSLLQSVTVPDNKESYYSPQILTMPDGTDVVLYGTGGETHGGSLWMVTLDDLYKGNIEKSVCLYSDDHKGVMTPPVLLDLTGDGIEDIVMSMFNSTIIAIDGHTHQYLWNHSFPLSESYNTPAVGYYNDDDVPDFMVKFSHGPGYPIYYYSVTTILDGRTGEPFLDQPIRDSVGAQASPLTISVEGTGNDIFLYWIADCQDYKGKGGEFSFLKGTNVHEQSRSDFCKLRFKTSGFSEMYALSQHTPSPGVTVYYSKDRVDVEHCAWVNTTKEGLDYVISHPELLEDFLRFQANADALEANKPMNKYKQLVNAGILGKKPVGRKDYDDYTNNYDYGTSPPEGADQEDMETINEIRQVLKNEDDSDYSELRKMIDSIMKEEKDDEEPTKPYGLNMQDEEPRRPSSFERPSSSRQPSSSRRPTSLRRPSSFQGRRKVIHHLPGAKRSNVEENAQIRQKPEQLDESRSYLSTSISEGLHNSLPLISQGKAPLEKAVQSRGRSEIGSSHSRIGDIWQKPSAELDKDVNNLFSSGEGGMHLLPSSSQRDPSLQDVVKSRGHSGLQSLYSHRDMGLQSPYSHRGVGRPSTVHKLRGQALSTPDRLRGYADSMPNRLRDRQSKPISSRFQEQSETIPNSLREKTKPFQNRLRGYTQSIPSRKRLSEGNAFGTLNAQIAPSRGHSKPAERTRSGGMEPPAANKMEKDSLKKIKPKTKSAKNAEKLAMEAKANLLNMRRKRSPTTGLNRHRKTSLNSGSNRYNVRHERHQSKLNKQSSRSRNALLQGVSKQEKKQVNTGSMRGRNVHSQSNKRSKQGKLSQEVVRRLVKKWFKEHSKDRTGEKGDRREKRHGGEEEEEGLPRGAGEGCHQKGGEREKRHAGPHSGEEGLQRLLSTGTLVPPLLDPSDPDYPHSMDLVFASYWFFPAKTQTLLPHDQECIDNMIKNETQRFDPSNEYYGMDHDAYENTVTQECLQKSGHQLNDQGTYESQSSYNPYNLHMGQMTVYRVRLKCSCDGDSRMHLEGSRCSRILPHKHQEWSAYMGRSGDSHWNPRNKGKGGK